jgi:enoyl-CoA hydratase/carnithine racemase
MALPEVSIRDAVCSITLSEPEKHNPLSPDLLTALEDTVHKLRTDRSVRVVVLRGAGHSFSSGADLRYQIPRADSWREARFLHGRWQRLLDAIESLPQITVAELHGSVFGGAFLLAIACDLRIASDDTRFMIPELRLGIPLTWAGLPRLVREIGLPRTRDVVLSGRQIAAEEAMGWGLITRLVTRDQLTACTTETVQTLLQVPEAPLAITKDALAALSRDRTGVTGWADPDFSLWSREEDEAIAARRGYIDRLAARKA